jgi:hypothetical protein
VVLVLKKPWGSADEAELGSVGLRCLYGFWVGVQHPVDEVFDALTAGLGFDPQLEILGSVVIAHAVDVVDVFPGFESSAQGLFHDEAVLELVSV